MIPPLSKTKLALSSLAVGTCASSAPFVFNSNKNPIEEKHNTKESGIVQITEENNNDELATPEALEIDSENEFSELWENIEQKYKERQSDENRKNNGLSWKEELKEVLNLEEKEEIRDKWTIIVQKWKDCKAIGGQDAYCGYLEIERGLENKYRLRVDRYSQGNNKWRVTIVKADGNKVKWYDLSDKKWKLVNYELQKFGGEEQERVVNWWVKLSGASISK